MQLMKLNQVKLPHVGHFSEMVREAVEKQSYHTTISNDIKFKRPNEVQKDEILSKLFCTCFVTSIWIYITLIAWRKHTFVFLVGTMVYNTLIILFRCQGIKVTSAVWTGRNNCPQSVQVASTHTAYNGHKYLRHNSNFQTCSL